MLLSSISGIRGTIGGEIGESLNPFDVVQFTLGYGQWILNQSVIAENTTKPLVVIGRDSRTTGQIITNIVSSTLNSLGINVLDLGMVPTPTVEMWVIKEAAQGGIIITASHNPIEYNGMKLLNADGEFLADEEGKQVLSFAQTKEGVHFATYDKLGTYTFEERAIEYHIHELLKISFVDTEAIKKERLVVVFDSINSVGGIALPLLFDALNIVYIPLHDEPNGFFAHSPEPLEKNLFDLKQKVKETGAHLGIAVDPDVDRLVLVDEKGEMFGEEYTLVAVADAVMKHAKGAVVTNLSSSRALDDLAQSYGVDAYRSKVGEKNVVTKMKEVHAVVGGEGSGGVILPELHHGRDALVGIVLILNELVQSKQKLSEIRARYTSYFMAKEKIDLSAGISLLNIFDQLADTYKEYQIDRNDGLWISLSKDSWVHLRGSNTEPIIRIYTEAINQTQANEIAQKFVQEVYALING
jgi:phosphomannomutase